MNFGANREDNKSNNDLQFTVKVRDLCAKKLTLYLLCGVSILISTSILITFIVIHVPKIYTENYAVVIDAGSTGSRAYLYKWKDASDEQNDVVTELSNCKADKLQKLDWTDPNNGLIACISNVLGDIPSSFMNRPYIYLASTAGMRLYQSLNPNATEIMFKNIEQIFIQREWRTQYIGIISGEVEGLSAWITANVLKNRIGKDIARQETIGAMDLGGSSTQIAYEDPSLTTNINLYSEAYSVQAKSYLCYGTNMFWLKYMTYVAITNQETSFHCLLKNTPVKLKDDIKVCRFKGSENLDFKTVTKRVVPDRVNCIRQISFIVDSEMKLTKSPPNSKFVAMSSYNYVFKFLRKHYKARRNITDFEEYTAQFCTEDYNDIPQKFKSEQKYAPIYCVIGMYIVKLFKGFGITDLNNLEFTDKIEGQNVGWNLGYMIDKTRSIPAAYIHKLDTSVFVAVIIIFSIVFVASVMSLFYMIWERHQKVDNINV